MKSLVGKVALSLLLGPLLGGCVSLQQYQSLVAAQERQKQKLDELELLMTRLKSLHEMEIRKLWGEVNCGDQHVRDFLRECQQDPDSSACSDEAVGKAMAFMNTQPYVSLFLRPTEGARGVTAVRRGQLMTLMDLKDIHPSTKVLLLIQPRAERPELYDEARRIGNEVSQYLHTDIGLPKFVPMLGPRTIPCSYKQEQLRRFSKRLDTEQPGEPNYREPRVRVWVFRTDC